LNGSQAITAVLLYRIAENHRRRPTGVDPLFVRYASCFIAMQMGRRLLKALQLPLEKLDHTVFTRIQGLIETQGEHYFSASVKDVGLALSALYGVQDISMQQLSATFRRGDLIERLKGLNIDGDAAS